MIKTHHWATELKKHLKHYSLQVSAIFINTLYINKSDEEVGLSQDDDYVLYCGP